MTVQPKTVNTRYMYGESYRIPVETEVLNMSPYEQDEWAVKWLKANKSRVRTDTHVRKTYRDSKGIFTGTVTAMIITTTSHKR